MSKRLKNDDDDMDINDVDETSQEIEPGMEDADSDSLGSDEDRPPSPQADDSLTSFVKAECVRQAAARESEVSSEPPIDNSRLNGFFANAYAAISKMQNETNRINAGRKQLEQMNQNPETAIWEEEMQAWH